MQNKGAIRLFAIILALVCVYQLSFTFFAINTENKAEEYAEGNKTLERHYLDSISDKTVFNFLGLRKYTYEECKEKEINLGLDLKGGMNVVLEISVEDVIKSVVAPHYLSDPMFVKTIQRAQLKKQDSQKDFIDLFAESYQEINPGGKLAQFFMTPETRGEIDLNTTNDQVVSYLKQQAESAIENSFNVLRNRIDRFGVVQPNIQRLERQGRILVELPGVDDPDRVARLLTGTANLEFWTTYENSEVLPYLQQANELLRDIMSTDTEILSSDTSKSGAQTQEASAQQDTSEISLLGGEDSTGQIGLLEGADTTGTNLEQEQMKKENPLFSVLTPYVDNNMQPVEGSVVGVASIKDTAAVNAYLRRPQIKAIFPSD
ncbi:MAG TPA: protein translocase subunit SecDF, partial [Bacteroidales bacterium]|nr:protein translocase subunit SecDF [Bacteroidales bacterium]